MQFIEFLHFFSPFGSRWKTLWNKTEFVSKSNAINTLKRKYFDRIFRHRRNFHQHFIFRRRIVINWILFINFLFKSNRIGWFDRKKVYNGISYVFSTGRCIYILERKIAVYFRRLLFSSNVMNCSCSEIKTANLPNKTLYEVVNTEQTLIGQYQIGWFERWQCT